MHSNLKVNGMCCYWAIYKSKKSRFIKFVRLSATDSWFCLVKSDLILLLLFIYLFFWRKWCEKYRNWIKVSEFQLNWSTRWYNAGVSKCRCVRVEHNPVNIGLKCSLLQPSVKCSLFCDGYTNSHLREYNNPFVIFTGWYLY